MTTISTSAFYERSTRAIADLRAQAGALQTAIGTGNRLTRSSDDPVAAAQLRRMARAEAFAAVDKGAASRASTDLTLADNALSEFAGQITRARELAVQAANGTLNSAQRGAIGTELREIGTELLSLANARDSAGHALFGGNGPGSAYTVDAAGNPVYAGTASAGELPLGDGLNVTRGVTGPEFLNFSASGGPTTLFAAIKGLADALQGAAADPAQAARDALGTLDAGLEAVTTTQTVVGTRLAWIDLVSERRTEAGELRAEQQAEVGGADLAETMTRLQQTMTVLEASQASFARLSSLTLFDLLR
ncbi:MAG TPA: flagellar biosynthesis protein FlgL [Novosphingobium sp.]|nr:flagellar biosynthesis protein FlgL [Novosphingobium sp.]